MSRGLGGVCRHHIRLEFRVARQGSDQWTEYIHQRNVFNIQSCRMLTLIPLLKILVTTVKLVLVSDRNPKLRRAYFEQVEPIKGGQFLTVGTYLRWHTRSKETRENRPASRFGPGVNENLMPFLNNRQVSDTISSIVLLTSWVHS